VDINEAIKFALLVNSAYAVSPSTTDPVGQSINADGTAYTVVSTIFANDLAGRSDNIVSIGLVLQCTASDDVVVAIRGTEGVYEWIQDAKFGMVPCPFAAAAGNTEDGFTCMYKSLRIGSGSGPALTAALATLPYPRAVSAVTPVTICGHSLGGALATLLTLDVAANTMFKSVASYTYASPRAGDPTFAALYNKMVPNSCRIANRVDIVPKLPLPPLYGHVDALSEVNPVQLMPPKILVRPDIACEHVLNTYLYLLSLSTGGAVIPLDASCMV
jgi:hypothetical protein